MTRMASYEEHEGKKDISIIHYFRGDYIGFHNFEELMQDIYKMDLLEFGKSIVILYLCVVGAYGVISYVMFASKYSRARKSLKHYYDNLKKLSNMYDK